MDYLFDAEGNQVAYQPEELPKLVQSGQFGLESGKTSAFVRPDTQEIVHVPNESAKVAFDSGLQWIGNKEYLKRANEEKYGTLPQQAATVGQELAAGATLGLSNRALTESGLTTPEAIEGRREANPTEATVANVAGNILPLLASEGSSAPAQLARLTPVVKLSNAARAVVPTLGEGLGARVATAAARGALEMPVYNAAAKADEALIQNKPLTVSAMLDGAGESAGIGALLGGGFEGALGVAGKVAPAVFGKAASALEKVEGLTARPEFDLAGDSRKLSKALHRSQELVNEALGDHEGQAIGKLVEAELGGVRNAAPLVANTADQIVNEIKIPAVDIQPAQRGFFAHTKDAVESARAVQKEWYERVLPQRAAELLDAPATQKADSKKLLDIVGADESSKHWGGLANFKKAQLALSQAAAEVEAAGTQEQVFTPLRKLYRALGEELPKNGAAPGSLDEAAVKSIQRTRDALKEFTTDTARFGPAAQLYKDADLAYAKIARGSIGTGGGFDNALRRRLPGAPREVSEKKANAFLGEMLRGGVDSQIAQDVVKHSGRMGEFLDMVARVAGPDDPLTRRAVAAAEKMRAVPTQAESAVGVLGKAKESGSAKIPKADKDVMEVYGRIRAAAENGSDADVFNAVRKEIAYLKPQIETVKLEPVRQQALKDLQDLLKNEQVFGEFATHYANVVAAQDRQIALTARLQKSFMKGEGFVKGLSEKRPKAIFENPGAVQEFVDQAAKGEFSAKVDVRRAALEDYLKGTRENLSSLGETYERLGSRIVNGPELHGNIGTIEDLAVQAIGNKSAANDLKKSTLSKGRHLPLVGGLEGTLGSMLRTSIAEGANLYHGRGSEVLHGIAKSAANAARSWGESMDRFLNGANASAMARSPSLMDTVIVTPAKKGETRIQAYERVRKDLEALGESGSLDRIADTNPNMGRYAPEITKAASGLVDRIASVVMKAMPEKPKQPGAYQPPPARIDMDKLERTLWLASHPISALGSGIANGTLTRADVDTAAEAQPEVVQAMQANFASNVAGVELSYKQEIIASRMLGTPMAPGLATMGVQKNVFGGMPSPKQVMRQAMKPPPAASAKLFHAQSLGLSLGTKWSSRSQ